ncbi:MAG: hypothetical protein SF066_15415 [Thermoanaerobaculia bacterium]|nr:hypothetical protein [Thermoanaerobaculia bacterium]
MKSSKALLLALLVAAPFASALDAQTCTVSREQVIADLAAGATEQEVADRYVGCVAEASDEIASGQALVVGNAALPAPIPVFASETVSNPGNSSTAYEAIKSCGYHPQREEAACTIEIRQRFGFGGVPAIGTGTHEWLLFCVDFGGGYVPIHTSALHVHDEPFGVQPRWSQAAIIQANPRLHSLANNGQTIARGRVILSWLANPNNNCNFVPIWGNRSDFRFKIDP